MQTLPRRPAPGFPGVVDVPVMRIGFGDLQTVESVSGALRAAQRSVDALQEAMGRKDVDRSELRRLVGEVERLGRRVDAVRLRLVAQADAQEVASRTGDTDTGAWLARTTKGDRRRAAGDVRLAGVLGGTGTTGAAASGDSAGGAGSDGRRAAPQLDRTGDALDAGDVSIDHARVIARALEDLPESVGPEGLQACETELVRLAQGRSPAQLRRDARRVLEQAEPDPVAVDAHEESVVQAEESAAEERTSFWIKDNDDGTMTGQFTVPWASGAILKKVIDAMTAPRRRLAESLLGGEGTPPPDGEGDLDLPEIARGTGLERWRELDWQRRRGLAFADLLARIPTDHLSNKVAVTMLVTTRLDDLRGDGSSQAATVEAGDVMSAGQARRLACGAGIVPAVLGTESVPLDLGRQSRLFSDAQRVALAQDYAECAADGCERPFAWCEVHHVDPWAGGGTTSLDNAMPLCGKHHRMIDGPDWQHTIRRSGRQRQVSFYRRT